MGRKGQKTILFGEDFEGNQKKTNSSKDQLHHLSLVLVGLAKKKKRKRKKKNFN